jgi:hypothetical protein
MILWQGNVKMKNTVIVKDYSEGGLKMLNLLFYNGIKDKLVQKNDYRCLLEKIIVIEL